MVSLAAVSLAACVSDRKNPALDRKAKRIRKRQLLLLCKKHRHMPGRLSQFPGFNGTIRSIFNLLGGSKYTSLSK